MPITYDLITISGSAAVRIYCISLNAYYIINLLPLVVARLCLCLFKCLLPAHDCFIFFRLKTRVEIYSLLSITGAGRTIIEGANIHISCSQL